MSESLRQSLVRRHRQVIGDGIWVACGQVAAGFANLAGTRLVTQLVSPDLYGVVNLVQNAVLLVRSLLCTPLFGATLRFLPQAEQCGYAAAFRSVQRRMLGWAVWGTVALTVIGSLVWVRRAGAPAIICAVLAVLAAADVRRTALFTDLNAMRHQKALAILSAMEAVARPLFIIAGVALLGASIQIVLCAISASILVPLLAAFWRRDSRVLSASAGAPPGLINEMARYAFPLLPSALVTWVVSVSDRYIIGWICNDTSSVGVYAAGYGLISQPFILTQAIITLTLRPVYFAAVAAGDAVSSRRTIRVWLAVSFAVCACLTALIIAGRTFLVGLLLGPNFQAAVTIVPWIALGYLIYVFEQVLEQELLAYKRTSAVFITQAAGALASVLVTVPLVVHFGMVGAAYACPIYFFVQCLVAVKLLRLQVAGHVSSGYASLPGRHSCAARSNSDES
jgi:O-antigen/teichoic acid export membrane protein